MTTTLEDIAIKYHPAEYVEQRIDDWKQRLNDLFSLIREWLPEGWEAMDGEPVVMHEKIMKSAGVEQTTIPTLKVLNQEGEEFQFKPRYLWVIAANGLIELEYQGELYQIYDKADNFEPPEWRVVNPMYWRQNEPLSEEWIRRILS